MNKATKYAKDIIKAVWKVMPREDKYNSFQFVLWLRNEQDITSLLSQYANELFPNEDEPEYYFEDKIVKVLLELEKKHKEKLFKKINTKDPLFFIKDAIKGTTWDLAKKRIYDISLAGGMDYSDVIDDERAEELFASLYKKAMGHNQYFVYDNNHGQLSKYTLKPYSNDLPYIDQFIRHYFAKTNGIPNLVRVYRGTNSPHNTINPGDYVTLDRSYADTYRRGKYGFTIEADLPKEHLYIMKADTQRSELLYWPPDYKPKEVTNIPSFKEFWNTYK